MTESQYKSTLGKTILCVFIYIVSGLIASYFIGSLIQFIIYIFLFSQGYLMDKPIVENLFIIHTDIPLNSNAFYKEIPYQDISFFNSKFHHSSIVYEFFIFNKHIYLITVYS